MKLAIVVPIYNEEDTLTELSRRLRAGVRAFGRHRLADHLRERWQHRSIGAHAARTTRRRRPLRGRRAVANFGHQAAISAGLAHADADATIVMDGDLQDPPEVIPDLVRELAGAAQVVRAERRSAAGRGLRRIGFDLFHRFFSLVSDFQFATNSGAFSLLDRRSRAANSTCCRKKTASLPGLRTWIGFEQSHGALRSPGASCR